MRVVFDIEANGLENPDKIWLVVCKDIDTNEYHIFRENDRERFESFAPKVERWIGHNILGYDLIHIDRIWNVSIDRSKCCDTLIVSKLIDYSREGHSIEQYGEEFGYPKIKFTDFSRYSEDMETYCTRDVDICHRVFTKYAKHIDHPDWSMALALEHSFSGVINALERNGFHFNHERATKLLGRISNELGKLDEEILNAFPPREVLVREFIPKATKHGTISRTSVPRVLWDSIHLYEPGKTYRHTKLEDFNPSSHKQLIAVLHEAGWRPVNKTKTHIETERELNRLKYGRREKTQLDIEAENAIVKKLELLKISGWKIDEDNLSTLPDTAPKPARLLAKRIMLESRRRTLTEWLSLLGPDGRIHGRFYGLGAWTHRMAHQHPNTANIPTDAKLFGSEMRSLWQAPKNRLLVGVDAEGIQLRVFAHYIDDKEFTEALVNGKKEDKSDPHSLNQRILGAKSRNHAKRFIFAYLLGGGIGKLSQILEVTEEEGRRGLDRLLERYAGLVKLKESIIPSDAKRAYFEGLDGRLVRIPGDTPGQRKHLCMSGYLQNGEAVIMKKACLKWHDKLKDYDALLVNFVHDEWQTECPNNVEIAMQIAAMQADSLRQVGEELGLKCPLAGSYWNDDLKDYTIGTNWKVTH
jgi:DNA polymerase-1